MGIIRNRLMRQYLQCRYRLDDRIAALRSIEKLDEHKLNELCKERLHNLLDHAYHHTAYYRTLLNRCDIINRDGSIDINRFENIPTLDKHSIRSHFDDLKSDDINERHWIYNTSGGSTGAPSRFIHDDDFSIWSRAVKSMFDEWSGYSLGYPRLVLWGSMRDIFEKGESVRTKIGRWLRNESWQNAYSMHREMRALYLRKMKRFKPLQVLAYSESLYDLASYAQQNEIATYSPRSIMVTAGTLFPEMRSMIERVFDTKVFNRYGSREVGDIACECEKHMGLHVSPYTQYLEIIRSDGSPVEPGETGEIVVTNLVNYAMPLIRYRIGDVGAWSDAPCSCGRRWPLLKEISGRVSDLFTTKDGTRIHGTFFAQLFFPSECIEKYQVIQKDIDRIELVIVPRENASKQECYYVIDNLIVKIKKAFGVGCQVEYMFVSNIDPASSGKYRHTISEVVQSH